jgi:hypothetical protein
MNGDMVAERPSPKWQVVELILKLLERLVEIFGGIR